jgi:hypothetical protein
MVLQSPIALISAATSPVNSIVVIPGDAPTHFQITGITTATVEIQGSVDGTNFAVIQSKSANALVTIEKPPKYVRASITSHSSGTVVIKAIY